MKAQRLRNLTTAKLHTKMAHIYEDLELITGQQSGSFLTHQLPDVLDAVLPWLKEKVTDQRFWDGRYDPDHTGKFKLPQSTRQEQLDMIARYKETIHANMGIKLQ